MINCVHNYWVVTLSVELRLPKYKVRLFVISYPSPTAAVARELEVGVVDKQKGCIRVEDSPSQFVNIDDIVQLYLRYNFDLENVCTK